jgi:DNA-directed RNA polymerase specialized sigma24 family protein
MRPERATAARFFYGLRCRAPFDPDPATWFDFGCQRERPQMPTSDREPITHWIALLKAGDFKAAQPLWECYFERLIRLAGARFRSGADFDREDIALSAFKSFCLGAARGRFPRLADRNDLWRLLVFITANKACDYAEHRKALKRGGAAGREGGSALDEIVGAEPTPEFAAMVAEEVRRLLACLDDEVLRNIALWKMEGFTNEEIATRLGCALKTVSNKLRLIRMKWERESGQ